MINLDDIITYGSCKFKVTKFTTYKDIENIQNNNFTIIYPNNGTASNPANVSINSRYVEDNPFTGYFVNCIAEVYYNNQWG